MKRIALVISACVLLASCNELESSWSKGSNARSGQTEPISGHIAPQGNVVSYADTVDRVAPAVVTVHAAKRVRAAQQFQFQNDPLFNWLFGRGNRQSDGSQSPVEEQKALGSGVIVRADGYVLTNDHVVDGAEDISIDLIDRRSFKAKLIGADKPSDLAVLKIQANNLPVLSPGDSDQVRVGDVCLAVGNPLGIGETVTSGIISAKGRQTGLSDGTFEDFLQTDAPINQGNSGGALVNTRAELIGINSQILSSNGGNIGIGFAIPSNMAKTVMDELIAHGKVSRGQLGVTVQYLTSDLAASMGLKDVRGVLVSGVTPAGAADRAGIKSGDIILDVNGTAVNDVNTLRNTVASAGAGTDVTLTTLRDRNKKQVRVKLGEFNITDVSQDQNGGNQNWRAALGMELTPVTPDIAGRVGAPRETHGLVVTAVAPGSLAAEAGIQEGDIVQQVNRQPVRTAADVSAALAKSKDRPALLQILREGRSLFIAVSVA